MTTVGEALKRTRIGRLKYSKSTNITDVIEKCKSTNNNWKNIVLSETDIIVMENRRNSSPPRTVLSPDVSISSVEIENWPLEELSDWKNYSVQSEAVRKHSSEPSYSLDYENELIASNLKWNKELQEAQDDRLHLIEAQYEQHMKLLPETTELENEKNLSSLNVENEIWTKIKISPRNSSEDEEKNVTRIYSSDSVKLSDDEDSRSSSGTPPAEKVEKTHQTTSVDEDRRRKSQEGEIYLFSEEYKEKFSRLARDFDETIKNFNENVEKNRQTLNPALLKHADDLLPKFIEKRESYQSQIENNRLKKVGEDPLEGMRNIYQLLTKIISLINVEEMKKKEKEKPAAPTEKKEEVTETSSSSVVEENSSSVVEIVNVEMEPVVADDDSSLPRHLVGNVTKDGWDLYCHIENETEKFLNEIKSLENDAMKKYVHKLKTTTSSAVNVISGTFFKRSLTNLRQLLLGEDDEHLTKKHPKRLAYCLNVVAEKIIKQAEIIGSTDDAPVFVLAAVVVALCVEFPSLKILILHHLFRRCPYLVPYYKRNPKENQSKADYLKSVGYNVNPTTGETEGTETFVKRAAQLTKFFVALAITPMPPSNYFRTTSFSFYPTTTTPSTQPHPFGLRLCWHLFASLCNLKPEYLVTSAILVELLLTGGYFMKRAYKGQFIRLLDYLKNVYLAKLKSVDKDEARYSYFINLERLASQQSFEKPKKFSDEIWTKRDGEEEYYYT